MSWMDYTLHLKELKEVNRKGLSVLSHLPFLVKIIGPCRIIRKGDWEYPGPDYMVSSSTSP